MGGKRKAQIWDCVEVFGKKYNNHHMYCFIDLEGHIDEELLQCAIDRSLEVFPIIKSRYVEDFFRAYWKEERLGIRSCKIKLVRIEEEDQRQEAQRREDKLQEDQRQEDAETKSFLLDEIKETSEIQIKFKLIRKSGSDRLCVAFNHMVCDAADFKNYLYTLSKIYTELLINKDYSPGYRYDGNRSGVGVYLKYMKNLSTRRAKQRALFRIQKHTAYKAKMRFHDMGELYPFISTREISRDRFQVIRQYCDRNKVTINDVFLAAFLRTVNKYLPSQGESLDIPCMVDLRRFLEGEELRALKNLTTTLVVNIGNDIGVTFDETVRKVHQQMEGLLTDFSALDGYLYLLMIFRLLPIRVVRKFIDRNFQSFPIAFSNLGIIDATRLRFGEVTVKNCMMTGSIKQKPCFWFALSSFDKMITLTINLKGSREDQLSVERFLEDLDKELPG